jgi:uncharacterized repeat protein (TIGR01451 family)
VKKLFFNPLICLAIISSLLGTGITPADAEAGQSNLQITVSYPDVILSSYFWSYDINITNTGDIPADNVTLTDTLPPGVQFVAASDNGSHLNNEVVWSLGTIGPAETRYVQVFVSVAWSTGDFITNHASVSTTTPESDYADNEKFSETWILFPYSDTDISASVNQVPSGGDNVTIRVTIGNYGNVPLRDINILLKIQPPGTEYVLDKSSAYFMGNDTDSQEKLEPFESWSWEIDTFLSENAVISAQSYAEDIVFGSPADSQDTIYLGSELDIYKNGPEFASQGSEITYDLYYSNWGTLTAENVSIIDTLPSGVKFISASNGGTYENGQVTWNAGNLDSQSSNSVSLTVQVSDNAPVDSKIVNTAEISTTTYECDTSNNTSSAKSTVIGGANLIISKKAPAYKEQGSIITYTIFYRNSGSETAENVLIDDVLPEELEFISASDNGRCEYGIVTWNLPDLEGEGSGYVTLTSQIKNAVQPGTVIVNSCVIKTTNTENHYDDNVAYAETTVTERILPLDVGVEPNNGGDDYVSISWSKPVVFSFESGSSTTGVDINIHINDGGPDINAGMIEGPEDHWTYSATFYPRHGETSVDYAIHESGATEEVSFSIYIDPAGYIFDTATGLRIKDASVWLQRPDGFGGWENVPTGQLTPVMSPDVNPLTTAEDGQYQWDTLAGTYRIHVEAAGYNPNDSFAVTVPPAVTDLHLGLELIVNKAPLISLAQDAAIDAGGYLNITGSFTDDDSDDWTAAVNYGDSPNIETLPLFDNMTFNLYHLYSTAGIYPVTVIITDEQGNPGKAVLDVTVNTTDLQIIAEELPDGDARAPYPDQTLIADNGVGPFTWSIKRGTKLPSGLKLKTDKKDTLKATIYGKPAKALDNFTFTIQVKDKTTDSIAEKAFHIHINEAVKLNAPVLPKGETDAVFPDWDPSASGGDEQYIWSISKGTLPEGLHLDNDTGVIYGIPKNPGTTVVKLTVTDSLKGAATKTLSIKILKTLEIITTALPDGEIGIPYKATLKAKGGTGRYTWSIIGSLPSGLKLEKGVIKGTPVEEISDLGGLGSGGGGGGGGGQYPGFTLQVTDSIGAETDHFSIVIHDPLEIEVNPPFPETAVVGKECTYYLTALGGSGSGYKWSIQGNLPKGLKLITITENEETTWAISGELEKAGTYKFKIKLTDSLKGVATYEVMIIVSD